MLQILAKKKKKIRGNGIQGTRGRLGLNWEKGELICYDRKKAEYLGIDLGELVKWMVGNRWKFGLV